MNIMNETLKRYPISYECSSFRENILTNLYKKLFPSFIPINMQFERKIVPMFGKLLIYEWHIPTTLCYAPDPLGSYLKKSEKFLRIVSVLKALGNIFLFKNMYIFLTPSPLKFFRTINHPSLS